MTAVALVIAATVAGYALGYWRGHHNHPDRDELRDLRDELVVADQDRAALADVNGRLAIIVAGQRLRITNLIEALQGALDAIDVTKDAVARNERLEAECRRWMEAAVYGEGAP